MIVIALPLMLQLALSIKFDQISEQQWLFRQDTYKEIVKKRYLDLLFHR